MSYTLHTRISGAPCAIPCATLALAARLRRALGGVVK